jgi:hypothetical protein
VDRHDDFAGTGGPDEGTEIGSQLGDDPLVVGPRVDAAGAERESQE